MIALAIDLSSMQGSLALFRDGEAIGSSYWGQHRSDGQALFREWPTLLQQTGVRPDQIQLYICGRGPGAFSGLRMSLSSTQAAALPNRARLYAISSGEAIAARVVRERAVQSVVVVGNARRDKIWLGRFSRTERDGLDLPGGWELVEPKEFLARSNGATVLVSPHYDQLREILPAQAFAGDRWIADNRWPHAIDVGYAAIQHIEQGDPSEPLSPLYLHSPVAKTIPC